MTRRLATRSLDRASVPVVVWPLLGLAALSIASRVVGAPSINVGALAIGAAPFLFAAAVAYVEPDVRRLLLGALLIAASSAVVMGTSLVDGALAFYVPILVEIAGLVSLLTPVLLIGGLVLFGTGLGGVRTRGLTRLTAGGAVMLAGSALALGQVFWLATHPLPEGLPIDSALASWIVPPALALSRAFLAGSAIDAKRTLLSIGSGLLFVTGLIDLAFQVIQPGPAEFSLLTWLVLVPVVAWAALIGGVLSGELNGSRRRLLDATIARVPETAAP